MELMSKECIRREVLLPAPAVVTSLTLSKPYTCPASISSSALGEHKQRPLRVRCLKEDTGVEALWPRERNAWKGTYPEDWFVSSAPNKAAHLILVMQGVLCAPFHRWANRFKGQCPQGHWAPLAGSWDLLTLKPVLVPSWNSDFSSQQPRCRLGVAGMASPVQQLLLGSVQASRGKFAVRGLHSVLALLPVSSLVPSLYQASTRTPPSFLPAKTS